MKAQDFLPHIQNAIRDAAERPGSSPSVRLRHPLYHDRQHEIAFPFPSGDLVAYLYDTAIMLEENFAHWIDYVNAKMACPLRKP